MSIDLTKSNREIYPEFPIHFYLNALKTIFPLKVRM